METFVSNFEKDTLGFSFIDKCVYVVENGELEFWENRTNPPNLSVDEFKLVIIRVNKIKNIKWVTRVSDKGKYGRTGEDECFKFNCEVEFGGIFEFETKYYFIKGYFFEKKNLLGVTIQSFREE